MNTKLELHKNHGKLNHWIVLSNRSILAFYPCEKIISTQCHVQILYDCDKSSFSPVSMQTVVKFIMTNM